MVASEPASSVRQGAIARTGLDRGCELFFFSSSRFAFFFFSSRSLFLFFSSFADGWLDPDGRFSILHINMGFN